MYKILHNSRELVSKKKESVLFFIQCDGNDKE